MASEKLKFTVQRQTPVLITPAEPTPCELKPLSDIDDQEYLRFQIRVIQFYRNKEASFLDPAKVIKEAIAKALVFYYPFAGRLKEGTGRKLYVECTGEGVLFVEADADVPLAQFESELPPPFPYDLDELMFNVKGSDAVLGCPLLLIQVTRLVCGGFIFALRLSHTMSDGLGLVQFMEAVAQMARGSKHPTIKPVWNRELLSAHNSPNPTFVHHEYDNVSDMKTTIIPVDDMVHKSFFFGPDQIANIKKQIPVRLCGNTSTFEIVTAWLWRCRTAALGLDSEEEVRVILVVNVRKKMGLPEGYYGNAIVYPVAVTKAEKLMKNPLSYAVGLVKKAKKEVNREYVKSVLDLLVRERPHLSVASSYLVSDLTKAGFEDVDFGWGKAVYGGPAMIPVGGFSGARSFYVPFKGGIVVPVSLPGCAMVKFVEEIEKLTAGGGGNEMDDGSEHQVRAIFSSL